MNKKGFTLIELLAVIVILAIIALIATPAVLNIIEDSRKGAAEASARNIVSTAKTYYMSEMMQGKAPSTLDLSETTLLYDGEQATKGYITFTDGKPNGKMYISGYCVTININGNVTSEKVDEDECKIEMPTLYTKYNDGYALLYDPVNNVKCSNSEVETNVNNFKANNSDSITGLKDGCMKWYVFLDNGNIETVNLILDHDILGNVAWNVDNGDTTPKIANEQLQIEVANWDENAKNTARLISANEVNQIAPTQGDSVWDVVDYNTNYYLHNGNNKQFVGDAGSNTYGWLFDNTWGCTMYGCNKADNGSKGYWTSSYNSYGSAWNVRYLGFLGRNGVGDALYGIRPVITVSKDVFK